MGIEELYKLFRTSSGVSTDTRKLKPGEIFFALKGPHFNANEFIMQALEQGACCVVADVPVISQDRVMVVNDALQSLQQLANFHRKQLKTKVIAIAGSNGKTTTKELLHRVLSSQFQTSCTQGNLNNHIGVPLTILSLTKKTEFAIIEMGANHLGETKLLCEIAEPDYGLITNNGKDHLEGYGSIENVMKGNGELYDFLRMKNRKVYVCADQEDLMKRSTGMDRITYGEHHHADCIGKIEALFPFLQLQTLNLKLQTNLIGRYNFENVMAAVCIGKHFGIPEEKFRAAIESYVPSNNRSQIISKGNNTFILDAYNANPTSMEAALENFQLMPAENKVVILGDMLELGDSSQQEHEQILRIIAKAGIKKVLLVGDEFRKAAAALSTDVLLFNTVDDLKKWFVEQHFENYHFLLKGSRMIQLEKLLN